MLAYGNRKAVIVFIVEDVNKNQLEQRHIEHRLIEMSKQEAKVKRITLTGCNERLAIDKKTNILTIDNIEVAVVYYCSGNSPVHYKSDREWNVRLKIEKSKAIKCPWIGLQLAGTRKMQQVLAKPGVLERFFPDDKEKVEAIRAVFVELWCLEQNGPTTTAVIAQASAHPSKYILKQLASGGSKWFHGSEIRKKASQLPVTEQSSFVLMERLQPMVNKNYFIRPFEPVQLSNCISELCVFGYLLGDGANKSVLRTHAGSGGHIVRTKSEHLSEEGTAIRGSCVDSPFLV
uniref:Glutathione synthetase n=1 Tax=Plectus sambesii TaxID=2011161 RepID=A0A914XDT6_9BILA